MGKLINAFLLIFIIEIGLILFIQQDAGTTPLTDMLLNLFNSPNTTFGAWFGITTAIVGVGIAIGTFITKQDWVWRAAIAGGTFWTFVMVLGQLWSFIYAIPYLDDANTMVATILVAPLAIYFTITLLEFVSGKD